MTKWFSAFVERLTRVPANVEAARVSFQLGREAMSEQDFASQLGIGATDTETVIGLRAVIGKLCGVSAELLRPEDLTEELSRLMWPFGWDWPEAVKRIECKLKLSIDDSLGDPEIPVFGESIFPKSTSYTLGEWISRMLPWLRVKSRATRAGQR